MFFRSRELEELKLEMALEIKKLKEKYEEEIKKKDIRYSDEIRALKISHEDKLRTMKNEYEDRRVKEMLELQVKTSQQIIDSDKKLNERLHEVEMEKINFKSELEKEFYAKMKDSLEELHTKGNSTTNFVQEMALKMLDVKKEHLKLEVKQDVHKT